VATNTSLARRLPGFDARHAMHRAPRRGRGFLLVVVVAAVVAAGAAAAFLLKGSSKSPSGATGGTHLTTPAVTVTSGVAPWTLRAPIDSEVVLAPGAPGASASAGELEVFGGSTTGHQPAVGIFTLDTSSGMLTHVGNLTTVLAQAAGAEIGGQAVVFGGTTPTPVATVQSFPATPSAPAGGGSVPAATVTGSLPEPRAGGAAVVVGTTTYLVGGDNGSTPDPTVLATTDGHTFASVTALPVPVAFAAVAAVGSKLYVFGGQALTGAGAGQGVTAIQVIDLRSHRAKVAGQLPSPLVGAAAVTLGGHVFVVGGDTSTAASAPPPSSSASGSTTPSPSISTSGSIWAFDPTKISLSPAGMLQTPVSHTGVAVLGSIAWLVGGSSAGAPTSVVQTVTFTPAPAAG
jgi:hypothetical protein